MMSNISTFNRKWLKWVVLLISMAILLGVGNYVFGYEEGTPLTTGETITYEQDGLFIIKFTALISFDVEWWELNGNCYQKPHGGFVKFYINAFDFLPNPWHIGEVINKNNLEMFYNAGNCDQTEIYIAGNTYVGYFADYGNPIRKEYTIQQIKENNLKDKDEEPNIDEESIFNFSQEYNEVQWYSRDFYLTFQPELDITYPIDETEIAGNFTMRFDYWNAEGYDRLMIVFEDWDIGSSCPSPTDTNYQQEFDVYFNNRSLPYFSSFLETPFGTTTIDIGNLEIGNYNCNKCYFLTTTGLISENLCFGYNLDVLSYIPPVDFPETYLPFEEWQTYYSEHSERFATSTPIFNTMAETFSPVISWFGNTILFFNNYFNPELAGEKGEEIGNSIRTARGYLESIDDFFGGLPISTIFIFYLITTIVVIIYRLIKGILTIIIP